MKTRSNDAQGKKKIQAPPKPAPAQEQTAPTNAARISFDEFPEIRILMRSLHAVQEPGPQQATECEDLGHISFLRASALLDYCADAAESQGGSCSDPVEGYVVDSIKLQLELLRLAGKTLYAICGKMGAPRSNEAVTDHR